MDAAKKLDKARIDRSLVDVHRNPRSSGTVWGYVSAVGKKWALIANARDGGYPDGFTAIRLEDVIAVRGRAGFEDAFAKTRTDWPESPLHLDLDSTRGLLESAPTRGRLIAIERERKLEDAMWVGVPVLIDKRWTWMHEVDADAAWREEPLAYRTTSITRVTWGDSYLCALEAVLPARPDVGVVATKMLRD